MTGNHNYFCEFVRHLLMGTKILLSTPGLIVKVNYNQGPHQQPT